MASVTRTIRRGIMFRNMNKQQKLLWKEMHGGVKNPNKKDKAAYLRKQYEAARREQAENKDEKEN